MRIEGRKILVLGAGKSGVAAATFLADRGAAVTLSDDKAQADWSDAARSLKIERNVELISKDQSPKPNDQIDLIVISPGVPVATIPEKYRNDNAIEIIGEVELACRFLKGKIVGITGSNGKTTTTALIGEILENAGIETLVGGNIGTPLLELTASSSDDTWTVAELSSYQLETIKEFRPDVAVCLNVTPNHLDRYDSFADYAETKKRLFMNQTTSDTAVLNADDEVTAGWAADMNADVQMFSVKRELENGFFLRGEELIRRENGEETVLTTRGEIFLRGLHNVENVLAAFIAATAVERNAGGPPAARTAFGTGVSTFRDTVRQFKGVEHRIEFVAEIDGVKFYNDSKATSVDAAAKALEALAGTGKTILILGGRGKNAPYAPLIALIESSVRSVVVIGEDADNIERQLGAHTEILRADSLENAVRQSFKAAEKGDKVLLAPACASFDMFQSYQERGKVFKESVSAISYQLSAISEKAQFRNS